MSDALHLGDNVELVTDAFAGQGAPRGSIGTITDDWADGSNDIEVRDPKTGEVIAKFRAAENDVRKYTGAVSDVEPREHGWIFGRGDDMGEPPGDPPTPQPALFGGLPYGGTNGPWDPPDIPKEEGEPVGDIPWELKEPPQTGPIII